MSAIDDTPSKGMPNHYDRTMGSLDGLPDVTKTSPSIKRVLPFMGVGGSQLFVVQTFRQSGEGGSRDTIFLEHVSEAGTVRLVVPPEVAEIIHRQYDSLTGKNRSKAGKARAAADKAAGVLPGFLRNPQPRKRGKRKKGRGK